MRLHFVLFGCITACVSCISSCTTAVKEVQSVGSAIVDAKSFKAAETIVAPLHTDLELVKERIDRLERKLRHLSAKVSRLKRPNKIRTIKEVKKRSKMWR